MKKMKKMLMMISICTMLVATALMLNACGGDKKSESTKEETQVSSEKAKYTVNLKTAGGMVLSGTDVYIYSNDSLEDLVTYAKTNEQGQVTFDLNVSDKYAIVLSGIADGYDVAASYAFTDKNADITLTSSLIQGEDLSTTTLGLGDVMYDFSVKTPDGTEVTLSEVLKEKDVVILNFWYTTCSWCVKEFPYMEEAYQTYKEDVEIIALNPMGEGDAAIKNFQETNGLSFIMAECPMVWSTTFGVSGYPTSIAVDRYGVICMIEAGGITSLRPFTCMFDHFVGDDYEQKLCQNGLADLITKVKPNVTMASTEEISKLINSGKVDVTYRPETEGEDAEYAWPFVETKKAGKKCLYASNKGIDDSYAIMYADVKLKKGQAFAFDYIISSEAACDILYIIVNDEDVYTISGVPEKEKWESCYAWVAEETDTYEVAFCYLKDSEGSAGDDTVYINNIRVVDESKIDTATYLPRYAATSKDGFEYNYAKIVYNSKDGYYHVGKENGPILLADLMNYTVFNEGDSIQGLLTTNEYQTKDGKNLYEAMIDYFTYASNSNLFGICPVNKELKGYLERVAEVAGFEGGKNEWLKICKYFQSYGTNEELEDPIKGLAPFSAFEAKLGKNVKTNNFYYNRAIIPRGLFAEFKPSKSGVYRITSHTDAQEGVEGWIFDGKGNILLTYENDERMYGDDSNVSMVYYMEKGKSYLINIAFWDLYQVGTIPYDIEYIGSTYQLFRLASPGYFTYDANATGDEMYYTIAGGIDVVLKDGKYYEDLGKKNGKQQYGSLLYCDFSGMTTIFDAPIATQTTTNEKGKKVTIKGLIDKGAFDFSKSENDQYILSFLDKNKGDVDKTDKELRELWGEDYDAYAEEYQLTDVYNGTYHGSGKDYTAQIKKYVSKMDKSGNKERNGCVVVTKELAEILQLLMEKFTFENVENSWTKICYYYDYLGPEK